MKTQLILLIVTLGVSANAQRVPRLTDSLTLQTERTWVASEGSQFTSIGDDCSYGLEIIFRKKDNQVELIECHEGEWISNQYEFEMITENGEHVIDLYRVKKFLFWSKKVKIEEPRLRVQMVSRNSEEFHTEVTAFKYDSKTFITLLPK